MQNQINMSPLTQFAQLLRAAELGQQKEVKMPIAQARLLSLALTEIQGKLLQDYESMYNALKRSVDTEVVEIQLDGGGFEGSK
jgi:hypothetical protein